MQKMQATNMRFTNMKKHVYMVHTIPFIFTQKRTNFSLQRIVQEPLIDGTVHVPNHVQTYAHLVHKLSTPFANDLICKCVLVLRRCKDPKLIMMTSLTFPKQLF